MSDQPFDQVSVALTADLTDLHKKMDKAAREAEKAGEEAGENFYREFSEQLAKAGFVIKQIADQMGDSFQDVTARLKGEGFFEMFTGDQLTKAAETMEQFKVEIGDVDEALEKNIDLQKELADIIDSDLMTAFQSQKDLVEKVQKVFEEYGVVLGEDVAKNLQVILALQKQSIEQGGEQAFTDEEVIASAKEKAEQLGLEEAQVLRVVEAYKKLGIAIPDALQRDAIRNRVKDLKKYEDQHSDVAKEATNFTDKIIAQGQALAAGKGPLSGFTGLLSKLGINLGGLVTSLAPATAAIWAMKTALDTIKKATAFALRLTSTTQQLAAAYRINQLAGEENTMSLNEWIATADKVMEITGQPMQNSMTAVADTLREMGASTELADDQIEELILTGARFSKQYGGTLPQSINQLSAFINTGVSQSLERLGLNISNAEQDAKAWEMRLGTNINKLSEADQRLVRYTLLMEELGAKTVETGDETKSFADRLDDANVATEQASKGLGNLFVPFVVAWEEFKALMKTGFTGLVQGFVTGIMFAVSMIGGFFISLGATIKYVLDNIRKDGISVFKDLGNTFLDAFATAQIELFEYQIKAATGGLDQYADSAEGAADATEDFGDSLESTIEQIEAFIDAARKFDAGMAKIEQKFLDRMDAITLQFTQRRADMETDFLRDMRDIDADAAVNRMDAIRGYMVDEIRLREDHALDIRQLEESYLLDLEDAVRERDARGVLSLQRKFNLEKKQREEDFNVRNTRLKQDFIIELAEIEQQRQRRRQERWVQAQEELMDLQMQEDRKRAAARLARDNQERDLLASIHARLMALQEGADEEVAILIEKLDALNEALGAEFGEEGPWVQWHEDSVTTVQNAAKGVGDAQDELIAHLWRTEGAIRSHVRMNQQAAAAVAAAWGGASVYDSYNVQDIQSLAGGGRAYQRGGSFIATGQQAISVGEGRPERVDITPLSGSTGKPAAGFGGSGGEKIGIDLNVEASELLVVEVADQTMQEVAEVFVNVEGGGSRIAGRT